MPQVPRQHLTVYLLRAPNPNPRDVLRSLAGSTPHAVAGADWEGELRIFRPPGKEPAWLDYVRSVVADDIPERRNRSTSALLFVRVSGRTFVFTFGHARHALKPGSYELDFGLRVALNSIDPGRLRSVDARTFEEQTVRSRRQVARSAAIDVFGIDVQRDLVNAVTGVPRDPNLASQLTGRDALAFDKRIQAASLGSLCSELLTIHGRDDYKQSFSWVDNIKAIRDDEQVSSLNASLVEQMRADAVDRISAAPPDIIDWQRIEGFRYEWESEVADPHALELQELWDYADPDATDDPVEVVGRLQTLTVAQIEDDQATASWDLFSCLAGELRVGPDRYVLEAGLWYLVNQSYVDEVERFVQELPSADLPLPDARGGHPEKIYNATAARAPSLYLLDRQNIRVLGRTAVEPCDLLSEDGNFVHVKPYSGSSTLSHLFMQGVVGTELFVNEPAFREELRKKLAKAPRRFRSLVPAAVRAPRKYGVVYAVIVEGGNPAARLPFFSQVSLRQAVQRLRGVGVKVYLNGVDVQP